MMITEHNYEEYFLLYIDNELTATERKSVEEFVSRHPEYSAMLSALQETKLPEENSVSFLDKSSLYKDESKDIGVTNYQEYFLLYTDNELTEEQKETTERFVLQHPQMQEEFTLLQQTKLTPGGIIEYKNKKELYKKERRIVPFYIAGLSAAATVFAVLFFTGLFAPGHQRSNLAASTSVKDNNTKVKPAQPDRSTDEVTNQPPPKENVIAEELVKDKPNRSKEKNTREETHLINGVPNIPAQKQPGEEIALAHTEETHLAETVLPDNNATVKQVSTLRPLEEVETEPANAGDAMLVADNNMVQTAVYKELNTNDDNHTLYVSGLPINKNKVNGFLKSASRLLGAKAKQNEQ